MNALMVGRNDTQQFTAGFNARMHPEHAKATTTSLLTHSEPCILPASSESLVRASLLPVMQQFRSLTNVAFRA
jgi:hypothetical protein